MSVAGAVYMSAFLFACTNAVAAPARSPTNDYGVIVERNLFGLRPLPPPPAGPEPPAPPKITLTGITTILGDKEVLMKVRIPSQPPQPPKDESLILSEGQRKDGIQVLAINLKTDDVTIDDFGTVVTLNLEKDGAKLNSPPPLPATSLSRSAANGQWPGRQFPPPSFNPVRIRTPFTSIPPKPEVRSGLNSLTWPGRR
jgi:hypothetical protein